MARRNSVEQLPQAVRDWLDKALMDGNFSGYQLLEGTLRDKGFAISKSAIHRYGQKIERRFAAIKASTEAARLLTEGAADDQDARSEAVIALVQTEMFESIVNLQEANEEDIKPEDRIALLSKPPRTSPRSPAPASTRRNSVWTSRPALSAKSAPSCWPNRKKSWKNFAVPMA